MSLSLKRGLRESNNKKVSTDPNWTSKKWNKTKQSKNDDKNLITSVYNNSLPPLSPQLAGHNSQSTAQVHSQCNKIVFFFISLSGQLSVAAEVRSIPLLIRFIIISRFLSHTVSFERLLYTTCCYYIILLSFHTYKLQHCDTRSSFSDASWVVLCHFPVLFCVSS